MNNLAIAPAERAALRASGLILDPVDNPTRPSKAERVKLRVKKELAWMEHARHCLPANSDKTKLAVAIETLKKVREWLEDPEL